MVHIYELERLGEVLQRMQTDPEKLRIIDIYPDRWKAAQEGRLTPEGVTKFEELNEFINTLANPQATPKGGET